MNESSKGPKWIIFFKFKKRLSGRFDRGLFDGHSLSNFQREGNNIRQPEALLVQ